MPDRLGNHPGFHLESKVITISNERLERFFTLFYGAYLTEPAQSVPPRLRPRGGSEYRHMVALWWLHGGPLAALWCHLEGAGAARHAPTQGAGTAFYFEVFSHASLTISLMIDL